MNTKKYTIDEIKYFLNGCRFKSENSYDSGQMNFALDYSIGIIKDPEDGIEAVLERRIKGE